MSLSITIHLPEGTAFHILPTAAGSFPQIVIEEIAAPVASSNQGHQPARGDIEAALAAVYINPSAEAATAAIEAAFQIGFVVLSQTTDGRVPPVPPITTRPPSVEEAAIILGAAVSIDHPPGAADPAVFLGALLASVSSH